MAVFPVGDRAVHRLAQLPRLESSDDDRVATVLTQTHAFIQAELGGEPCQALIHRGGACLGVQRSRPPVDEADDGQAPMVAGRPVRLTEPLGTPSNVPGNQRYELLSKHPSRAEDRF